MLDRLRRRLAWSLCALASWVDTEQRGTVHLDPTGDASAFQEGMKQASDATARFHAGGIVRSFGDDALNAAMERAHEALGRFVDDGGEYPWLDGR